MKTIDVIGPIVCLCLLGTFFVLEACLDLNAADVDKLDVQEKSTNSSPTLFIHHLETTQENKKLSYPRLPILANRLTHFRAVLGQSGVIINADQDLLVHFATPAKRKALSVLTKLPEPLITLHLELADLERAGIPSRKAQLLLFSQLSNMDPFHYEVTNCGLLPNQDQFDLKMRVDNLAQDLGIPTLEMEEISVFQQWARASSPMLEYGNEFQFLRSP